MPSYSVYRFSRWLEARFNVKGGVPIIDINPSLDLAYSYVNGNDDRYLQGWNRFGFGVGQAGAAAQNAAVELHNPPGSNIIAVVERLGVKVTAATFSTVQVSVQYGGTINDFATVVTPVAIDGRQQAGTGLKATSTANGTGFSGVLYFAPCLNALETQLIVTLNQEIVLTPGSAFIAIDQTLNEGIQVNCFWRERALEQSELT